MTVIGWPRQVNTNSGCSPGTSSMTDIATRLSTSNRSSPFLTRSSGMMKTLVPSSGTGRMVQIFERTVDTLLAWHRKLIAQKWTYARKGPGRPRVAQEIIDLVLRMARENTSWGYDRIQGALTNVGYVVAPNTVKNILKRHGIEPAPEREKRTSWTTFLKSHWDVMAATDFFTVEVWTPRGLATYYVLFVIHLSTRSVHFAGVTTAPQRCIHEASSTQPDRRE